MRVRRFIFTAFLLALSSCSTTRVLQEGEYRLADSEIVVNGESKFNTNKISSYVRQKPNSNGLFGWTPLQYIYNWSLKDGLLHKIGTAPVVYSEADAVLSVENLRTQLDYLGYYNSGVRYEQSTKGKNVKVKYIVDLGKQYTVDTLIFDIPPYEDFSADFKLDTATMKKAILGKQLSAMSLESEAKRGTSYFRDRGYFDLSTKNYFFEADTLSNGTAKLIYSVRGYPRGGNEEMAHPLHKYYIGNVYITKPKFFEFNENLLRNLNTIHTGDVYSESVINNTYSRFSNIRSFSSVSVEMTPVDTSTVDCKIAISPTRPQGFKVKLEGSLTSSGLMGVSPELSYFHKNLFHGGEMLTLAFNGDFQYSNRYKAKATEIGVASTLSIPRFVGLPYSMFQGANVPRTDIKLAFSHQQRPEFTRNLVSTSFGYSGNFTKVPQLSYQFYPLRANFVKLNNIDDNFYKAISANPFMRYAYQDHLDAGVSATLYYNSSSDIVPQSSYITHRFSLDLSGNVLSMFKGALPKNSDGSATIGGSPFAQYVRAEYALAKAWQTTDNSAIAFRFSGGAGYAYGNSSALPYEQQFYVGGSSSLRGWQARGIGPGSAQSNTAFSLPSQTGDLKLEANAEYRFGMFWKLEGALFCDVGNVWTFNYDSETSDGGTFHFNNFYKSLAADWGLGVRVNLSFILLRLDFGMKLIDPSLEEGSRIIGANHWLKSGYNALHFGVGYPF